MKYFLFILLCFSARISFAQPDLYSETEQITIKEGLISNNLTDCLRDKNGFFWISSEMGITRYAGFNSIHFKDANSKIKDKNISKLLLNDSILIGLSKTEIYFINTQNLSIEALNISSKYGKNTDLVLTKDSKLYISTDLGFIITYDFKINQKSVLKVSEESIFSLTLDKNSNSSLLLVHQHIGYVYKLDIKNHRIIKYESVNITFKSDIFFAKKEGALLRGYNLLFQITNDKIKHVELFSKPIRMFNEGNGNFICITAENRIYLGGDNKEDTREIILKEKGFDISKVYFDYQGDIIIITSQGLFILRKNTPFEHITEMLPYNSIIKVRRSIEEDKERNRLFYFTYQGIEVFNTKFNKFEKKLTDIKFAFATDNDGENIWIGTDGDGIYQLKLNDLSLKRIYKSLDRFTNFTSILKIHTGNLLLGTYNDLVNYNIKTGEVRPVDLIYKRKLFKNFQVNSIIRKSTNEIWVTTDQGVFVLNESYRVLSHYAVEELHEFHLPSNKVNCLYFDSSGIFFGLDNDLFIISKRKEALSVFASKSLSSNKVIDIKKDRRNRLWVATYSGIYLYDRAINNVRAFQAPFYLQNNEFNRRASFVNSDNEFYYGTVSEYFKFNPENYESTVAGSSFLFNFITYKEGNNSRFIYNYNPVNILKLPTKETALTFSYLYTDVLKQKSVNYYYKIEGLYDQWIPVFDKKSIELFSLPSGQWKINIKAVNNDDFISKYLELNVLVPTIFYQTIWFQLLVFLGICLIFFAIYLYQKYNQNKLMAFRIELANELHDTVGTAVTKTIYAAEGVLHDYKLEDKRLAQIAEYGRQINNSFRDALWSADEGTDQIHNIVDRIIEIGHATAENSKFEFEFINNIGKDNWQLKLREKRTILLVVREALHNVLKHSNGNLMHISIYRLGNKILLEIFDNGVNSKESLDVSSGMGIKGMTQRINRIGASIDIQKNEKGFFIRLTI